MRHSQQQLWFMVILSLHVSLSIPKSLFHLYNINQDTLKLDPGLDTWTQLCLFGHSFGEKKEGGAYSHPPASCHGGLQLGITS